MEQEEEEARRKRTPGSTGPERRSLRPALLLLLLVLLDAPHNDFGLCRNSRGTLCCLTKGGAVFAAASEPNVTLSEPSATLPGAANSSDTSDGRLARIHNRPNEINKQVAPPDESNNSTKSADERPAVEAARAQKPSRRADNGGPATETIQQEPKQTMTNDVLCNSRCDCLQLQFSRAGTRAEAAEPAASADKKHEQVRDAASNGQTSSGQDATASGASKQPAAVDLNQIALIEFGQDYSFDEAAGGLDELAEQADDRATGQLDPSNGAVRAQEPDEAGSGGPLMWLPAAPAPPPPPLQLDGGTATASNQLGAAKLDQVGAGSGDRPTIKMAGRPADQSSASARASGRQKAASLMDPLNPSFITLPAGSLGRNFSSIAGAGAPASPLNGHALLLPSFKQPKKSQQAKAPMPFEFGRHSTGRHLAHSLNTIATATAAAATATTATTATTTDAELKLEKISPLRSLNLSDRKLGDLSLKQLDEERERNLTGLLIESLGGIERERVQSLSLRQNSIKFELWTQLYSLLLPQLRTQLHRLDLSHNSLVKLGVTFTGYIEHHFVYQLVKSNGSDAGWPFSVVPPAPLAPISTSSPSNTAQSAAGKHNSSAATERPATAGQSSYMQLLGQFKLSTSSTSALPAAGGANSKRLFRRPILGDGRVYSAVRLALPLVMGREEAAWGANSSSVEASSTEVDDLRASAANSTTSYQQLVQLLLHQPAQLKALDLSHNKLKWLINDQFRVLKRLQSLRLDHNRVRFIHQQAFNGLTELKYLNLNFNRLQTIYMEQFQTNYRLQALFARSNYLTYLRAGSLASLGQLKRLDLARNKFTILSSNAFVGLESLELLNLSSNSFVHVPSASFHPLVGSLKQLDLSDNQLAQLMPGAFFHLEQLERLALSDNDQLVSIDRGAFWDLARLGHLSLRSSSQLLEINAQAFVGVPQLKSIQVDDCPLLDRPTREMLDNITAANTMRTILKQQQQQQEQKTQMVQELADSTGGRNASSTDKLAADFQVKEAQKTSKQNDSSAIQTQLDAFIAPDDRRPVQKHQNNKLFVSDQTSYQQQMSIQLQFDEKNATQKITKYFYCLGALALCVVALKLVFKFSSTRRYLELRRRRRRVYESSSESPDSGSSHSSSVADDCMSATSKGSPGDETADGGSQTTSRRARSSSSLASNDAFSLVEQQPYNVIKRRPAAGRPTSVPEDHEQENDDAAAAAAAAHDPHQIQAMGECASQLQPLELAEQMSEIDLSSGSADYLAECCPDCLSQRQMELETGGELLEQGQLPCCDQLVGPPAGRTDQLEAQIAGQAAGAYDNDELLRDLAAASGLCGLEHANCTHCYQSAVAAAHYQQQPHAPLACCETNANEQREYYATDVTSTQPLDPGEPVSARESREAPPSPPAAESANEEAQVGSRDQVDGQQVDS